MNKVMIVEDNEDSQIYLKTIFNKRNINTIEVCNGNKVMEIFNNNINDISFIMMDISLPGTQYNGIDFTKMILSIKKLPIIIQTGYMEYREEALKAGCSEYLIKPYTIYKINNIINKYYS